MYDLVPNQRDLDGGSLAKHFNHEQNLVRLLHSCGFEQLQSVSIDHDYLVLDEILAFAMLPKIQFLKNQPIQRTDG